jgi:eukaryotic-like serine/threonine-protein kinase
MVASRSPAFPSPGGPVPGRSPAATLRTLLDTRRADKTLLSLGEAAAVIVPLCLDLQQRHERGEQLLLHPSCVESQADGLAHYVPRPDGQAFVSNDPRDRACLPPELAATLTPGGPRATVFSIGAILYECVTGGSVGPGMMRPRDVNPKLPQALDVLLAKALVADPAHRPDDLGALASALHNLAPKHSIHPPDVDEGRLDHGDDFEVDIKLSMLPPPDSVPSNLRAASAPHDSHPGQSDPPPARVSAPNLVERLAGLKKRLESDARPRYVVSKDHMDHGPFSAVELLQQIASNGFVADDLLRDELSGQTRPIKEWEEFAPFSEQAALKREVIEEKRVVAQVAKAEKKAGLAKSSIGIVVVVALAAGATLWFLKSNGSRNDDVEVANDSTLDLALDGGIKGKKKAGGHGGHGGAGGGGGGGMSYEAALAANPQQIAVGGPQGVPDLTDQQLSGPLRNASFLDSCGAPQSMHVTVKTVVKMGHAIGVSVYTTPPNGGVASCVDRAVRNVAWPVSQKADSFVTNY